MIISVKSQMDSRVMLYSLLRACDIFGSVCLISSNPVMHRLIDLDDGEGFRNIRVIIDESGALDDVYQESGILPKDYDYIILDNMGAMEYDSLIVPVGECVTEDFQDEIELLKRDSSVRFFQYGNANSTITRNAQSDSSRGSRRSSKYTEEEVEEKPEDKFHIEDIEVDYKVKERVFSLAYPSWQDIELVEGSHKFPSIDSKMSVALYDILRDSVQVTKNVFDKALRAKDTGMKDKTMSDTDTVSDPRRRSKRNR